MKPERKRFVVGQALSPVILFESPENVPVFHQSFIEGEEVMGLAPDTESDFMPSTCEMQQGVESAERRAARVSKRSIGSSARKPAKMSGFSPEFY
jgi:hypothetical protein